MAKAKKPSAKKKAAPEKAPSRATKKLQAKRAATEQNTLLAQQKNIGKLTAEIEGLEKQLAVAKQTINEQARKIKAQEKAAGEQGQQIENLRQKASRGKQAAWGDRPSNLQIAGNVIQILKQGQNEKYPDSYFPVGELLKGEIDDDATLDDIKEYVKGTFKKGSYRVKAYNDDEGHKIFRGSARFTI